MRIGKTRRKNSSFKFVLLFLAVAVVGFFGVKFLFGPHEVPRAGELIFDATLSQSEIDFVKNLLRNEDGTEQKFALPIKVSARLSTTHEHLTFSELVPVTDWYSLEKSISPEDALKLPIQASTPVEPVENPVENSETTTTETVAETPAVTYLLEPKSLNGNQKLLAIGANYYLDDTTKGAVYRVLELSLASDADELSEASLKIVKEHASDQKYQSAVFDDLESFKSKLREKLPKSSENQVLTFAQTGVTALSRAMVTRLNGAAGGNGAYFAENIKDFLASKDLTHISNEVSFADSCPGGSDTVVLCADWRMLDAITAIGTDIIELTGNHNNDYGAQANLNTIAKYEELGLKTFGGGKDEETARKPLEINQKGTNITLIGFNQSTTTAAYGGANGATPGANLYNEAVAKQQITEAKARGDFVIVDIQYYECYCYPEGGTEMPACDSANNPAGEQAFFRHIADLGADLVIGTQAHQPQTYELYNGTQIYYGLGNLFFDQTYWPGTTRGLVLTHYFLNGNYAQTVISPTVYDTTYQTKLMDETTADNFLRRLLNSSPRGA